MFRNNIKIIPRFIKKVFFEHDISRLNLEINKTQTNILMFVNENSGKSMSEISLMTGLEKSSFTRSVDFLVKNGFITRNSTEQDRRKIKLSLTSKGMKAAKRIKEDFDIYLDSLISDFSEKEKKEFNASLNTISKYINKIVKGNKI
jgi:MarR family transcriptional regulator, organic hydroperoxide resistance regulator